MGGNSCEAEPKEKSPCRLGTRAAAGEVPEWLKSAGRNSAGGGSDQRKSYDVWEIAMVNKDT